MAFEDSSHEVIYQSSHYSDDDDYECEKTKNLLQGRGLIRYNEKTQKMTITMPRS